MSTTLRTVLLILLFAFIMQMQTNLDADKTASRQLKNSLELAVHDASMAIYPDRMAEGKLVFDQNTAKLNFKTSLEDNLKLSSKSETIFTPTDTSFLKNDVQLVDIEFIDDSIPRTYPFVYTNPDYEIMEVVDGPCVIAVMTTESPRWFIGGTTTIRQAAVYEYRK